MIPLTINYATPSVLQSTREHSMLAFSADQSRPVRFHAKVKRDIFPLRIALQTLGELVWRSDEWTSSQDREFLLDPIISVHPDRIFFEALSGDQSVYGLLIVERDVFEPDGLVQHGTTNVDFTAWLWSALAEMRSSRETIFRIGSDGFEVRTTAAGGRFEKKVDVPEEWVRGFCQLQGAMALPGTRLDIRPIDLLATIRFLRSAKAKVSPRAMRYEFDPGQDAKLVLEPWEKTILLRGASHTYTERRVIRLWGRRRLKMLEPLLPYADRVEVFLKGRALPSFYAIHLPGMTFVFGLTGWTSQRWTGNARFDLLTLPENDRLHEERILSFFRDAYSGSIEEICAHTHLDSSTVSRTLSALAALGRCIYDLTTKRYRYRELFKQALSFESIYPPDHRREAADRYLSKSLVFIQSESMRETLKRKRLQTPEGPCDREIVFRDWVVQGRVGEQREVEIVLNDEDRLIFGRCGCAHFREHLLNQGPCEHMLALLIMAQPQRKDLESSRAAIQSNDEENALHRKSTAKEDQADEAEPEDLLDDKS